MRVAAVQYKSPLRALVHLASEAGRDADLVVLPEMAVTGYVFPDLPSVRQVAEAPDGPTYRALSAVASENAAWIVAGFPELAADRVYNSALVIDPSGARAFVYRKTLLYVADLPWATAGDSGYRRFDTDHGSFGVGICMDLNDDRFVDWCTAEQLDVVAMPTNWIDEGTRVWDYWAWRVHRQGGALVAANTWGSETHDGTATHFSGASAVIRRTQLLAAAPKVGNAVVSATLPGAPGAP